jgi:hypothetical protein
LVIPWGVADLSALWWVTTDTCMSRVLKHIPSEIVMAYVAIEGILRASYGSSQGRQTLLWGALAVLTVLTPLWRMMGVRRVPQLIISTIGPFEALDWYRPALGAIVLPIYTLVVPIVSRS